MKETLASLYALTPPAGYHIELIVIDNGSRDGTVELISSLTPPRSFKIILLSEPRPGKSRALNLGLNIARGTALLFTDDDVRFPATWLNDLAGPILENRAEIVQGGIHWAPHLLKVCPRNSYIPRVLASTGHKTQGELAVALIGANLALHRKVFDAVPGFDEDLGPGALGLGEETLLGWQLAAKGFRRINAFESSVEHHFDARRLSRAGLLDLATKRGRSLAYLDYHWKMLTERNPRAALRQLRLKDILRSLMSPSAWPGRKLIPEWKFSYQAGISRLEQIQIEARRPRRYSRPA